MSIQFSPVLAAQPYHHGGDFIVYNLGLHRLRDRTSPILSLDRFQVRGRPFPPHPHAGFSAVTYVLEDSPAGVRSRDSLGNDLVVGPGGLIWTEAGSGVIHEESPARPEGELHGFQIFVDLDPDAKLAAARVLHVAGDAVPEWRSGMGDRVRAVVGDYQGASSALVPATPFHLLDFHLKGPAPFDLAEGHNALVYVLTGLVRVSSEGQSREVPANHGLALQGGGALTFEAFHGGHFLLLAGAALPGPVLSYGPFFMNTQAQLEAAYRRFHEGAMGYLAPLVEP